MQATQATQTAYKQLHERTIDVFGDVELAEYDRLVERYIEVFGRLMDLECNFLVGIDDPRYGRAMVRFTRILAQTGWTWGDWFAAEGFDPDAPEDEVCDAA